MLKSDVLFYGIAALCGFCAGILEITLGDLLTTALFVLIATMVLGFLRPKRAWRWVVTVGIFVPLVQLAAYLLLAERPYRAQIWESGLGFVTATAGAYCGAFARKAVDELFRPDRTAQ
jgi:hypothetical protein